MEKYKILEHKADLKIKIFGKTKEELFLNALLALEENLRPVVLEKKVKREIKIQSIDLAALLVDFLAEALCLSQINKEFYNNIKFKKFSDQEIEAVVSGQKIEDFGEDIKAVTHHDLEINQKETGEWEAIILFDI